MKRDLSLDLIRGFATFLVLFGHVLQLFPGHETNIIFNIIFSIQMPLFMMVSGYAIKYSKVIDNKKTFIQFLKKRTISMMLPWMIWCILICIIIWDGHVLSYIQNFTFKMELAYWFFFSLWWIDIIFSICKIVTCKITSKPLKEILFLISYSLFIIALLLIGSKMGMTFLGIKYTTYYSLYFILGYYLSIIENFINIKSKTSSFIYTISIIIFSVLIANCSITLLPDASYWILLRVLISTLGCYIVFYYCKTIIITNNFFHRFFIFLGNISLEMYLVQYFTLRYIPNISINLNTLQGMTYAMIYFIVVLFMTLSIIHIIKQNKYSNFLFFSKKTEN